MFPVHIMKVHYMWSSGYIKAGILQVNLEKFQPSEEPARHLLCYLQQYVIETVLKTKKIKIKKNVLIIQKSRSQWNFYTITLVLGLPGRTNPESLNITH